jgi:hypothetical protein
VWEFTFEVEAAGVYSVNADANNMDALLRECNGIPMVTNLNERSGVGSELATLGDQKNIWFETVNTSLEHTDG